MNVQRLSGRVVANVGLTVLALIFSGLVPFSFNLLVGRVYGPAVMGEISVVLGLALFLGQVPSTVGIAATKFMAEALGRGDETDARAIFQFLFALNLGLTGLLTGAMVVAAPWIHQALHVPVAAVLLGAVLLLVYSLYLFFKSVYYGIQRVGAYVWNEIISDVAFFAQLAAVFVFHTSGWLLLPFVLNNAVFAAIAGYQLRPYFRHFRWVAPAGRSEILQYWVVNGLGSAASLGRTLLGTTVAGFFLTHHAVGLYAAAVALTTPLQLIPRALALVLFATMARLHGAGRASSVRDLLDRSTEWLVLALGLLCGLLIINAAALLTTVFRSAYAPATTATQLVVFGSYLLMISSPAISALSSTTHVRIPTIAAVLGLATSLALWLLLIPRLGIDGAALGFALGSVVTGSIPAFFAYRLVGTRRVRFLRLGAILGALAAVLLLMGRIPLVASAVFVVALALVYLRPGRSLVSGRGVMMMATKRPLRWPRRVRWRGALAAFLLLMGLLMGLVVCLVARGWEVRTAASQPTPASSRSLEVVQTRLCPGTIEVQLRNDGAQPVTIAQVSVNDAFWPFTARPHTTIAPHGTAFVTLCYPWDAGAAYEVQFVTSTGATYVTDIGATTTASAASSVQVQSSPGGMMASGHSTLVIHNAPRTAVVGRTERFWALLSGQPHTRLLYVLRYPDGHVERIPVRTDGHGYSSHTFRVRPSTMRRFREVATLSIADAGGRVLAFTRFAIQSPDLHV